MSEMRELSSTAHRDLIAARETGSVPETMSTDDALTLLTGPDAGDLLSTAVEAAGGHLVQWSVRDVDHRPGDRTTTSYTTVVDWPDGRREETLGANSPVSGPVDGAMVTNGDHDVQVWRFPFDPELPALAAACTPAAVAQLFHDLGLDASDVQVRVLTYRPRKRAVVEATAGSRRLYLKVLRPRLVADVHQRHRMLTDAGMPVPRSLGYADNGLLVIEALAGDALGAALHGTTTAPVSAGTLTDLLDRLPPEVADLPRRKAWSEHAMHYADVVAASSPALADRVAELAKRVESVVDDSDVGSEPTHGDFYEAQVYVAGGDVTGLLDIDTLGPGHRADDLACMLAHLSVVASGTSAGSARTALVEWTPVFERAVGRRELFARTAGVLLSLATGPFRAQEPDWQTTTELRVALAEHWAHAGVNDQ